MIGTDEPRPAKRNALEEQAGSLQAAATSGWAQAGDVAVAALDEAGHVISSAGPAWHVVSCEAVMAAVLERFGDDLGDGDLVVHNDPYTGGTALVDLSVVAVHDAGGKRHYGITRMRIADVGGGEPGGVFPDARLVIQEGDRVPVVRIAERGRLLPDLVRRLAVNTRRRAAYERDLMALSRSAEVAARLDPTPTRAKRRPWRVRREGAATVTLRGDLLREARRLNVRIVASRSGLEVDFSGTAASDPGPGNIPWAVTTAAAVEVLHAVLGEAESIQAMVRRITWSADVGCMVRPAFPSACSGGGLYAGFAVRLLVARALEAMGLPSIAYPTWTGGAVLSGPPAAEYATLLALDCPGQLELLPSTMAGVQAEVVNVDRWGREARITGPSDAGLRLTTWLMEIEGEGPGPCRPAVSRAGLPARVWLSSGLR